MTTAPESSAAPEAAQRLAVAPDRLAAAARVVTASAHAVAEVMGGIDAAWTSAAAALHAQRTGQALGAFALVARDWVSGCAQGLSALGGALQHGASVYAHSEAATVPPVPAAR